MGGHTEEPLSFWENKREIAKGLISHRAPDSLSGLYTHLTGCGMGCPVYSQLAMSYDTLMDMFHLSTTRISSQTF